LRVDATGKPFVLLDSPYQEIRSLRFDDKGTLFVAAQSGRPSSGGSSTSEIGLDRPGADVSSRSPVPSVSAEITSMSIVDVSGGSGSTGSTREDRRAPRGAVYRISPDGLWDLLWESR